MKIPVAVALCLASIAAGFAIGHEAGSRSERRFELARGTYLNAMNALASYQSFSELSQHISKKQEVSAQCMSDIRASLSVDLVKTCLADSTCGSLLKPEVSKLAPELLTPAGKLGFRYYANRELCPAAQ